MEKESLRERFCKKNMLAAAAVSVSLFFTIYFFSPVDMFLNNQKDFAVTWDKIVLPMLAAAAVVSVLVFLFLCLVLLGKEGWFKVLIKLGTGLLAAGYFQMLFLNGKMPQLSGDLYNTKLSVPFLTVNLFLFVIVAILPLILGVIKQRTGGKGVFSIDGVTAAAFFCGAVFVMQLAGVAGSYARNGILRKDGISYNQYFSYEPTMHLSKENNVIIFMYDKMDSFWTDDILSEYPELNDSLDGFTFYQNNVSTSNYTSTSVTEMVTGVSAMEYDDIDTYIQSAWEGDTPGDILKENGWNVYLNIGTSLFNGFDVVKDRCENAVIEEGEDNVTFLYRDEIIPTMTDLSLGKLVPYIIKTPLIDKPSSFSTRFFRINDLAEDAQPMGISDETDIAFYNYLTSHRLKSDSDKPTYSFIHINGCHDISERESALYSGFDGSATQDTTARGALMILEEYIAELKELGIYDNTTIILLGDHGSIYTNYISAIEEPQLAALLLKPAGDSGKLKLDPDSEMSNKYLPASVLEYAGLDHEVFGISYSDVTERGITADRILQTYDQGGEIFRPEKLKITGNARDFSNWQVLEHNE